MATTVLFLCPHHAAKSVVAQAYFNRLAQQYGLPVRGDSAGTEPDKAVAPAVVELLRQENIDVSGHQPRLVTEADLAQRIISMGCTAEELGIPPNELSSGQMFRPFLKTLWALVMQFWRMWKALWLNFDRTNDISLME